MDTFSAARALLRQISNKYIYTRAKRLGYGREERGFNARENLYECVWAYANMGVFDALVFI